MPRFKDQAICIRHLDWSETSQVVVLLTRDHGKQRGLAKGSKRTSPSSVARYSGGIELLTGGEIVGIIKPHAELATLTEWDLQQPWWHLHRDYRVQQAAMYGADLANAMLADHDNHPRSFAAMAWLLADLADGARLPASLLMFQWRLLNDCGYRPELDRDARSGQSLPDRATYVFDPRAGGLTLSAGGEELALRDVRDAGPWRIRRQTVEVLRQAAWAANQTSDSDSSLWPPSPGPLPPWEDAKVIQRANRLLCVYARAILDRSLPTMSLLLNPRASLI